MARPTVLRLEEVERPAPKEDEVLIRIRATTVNRTDCHIRRADPFFWRFFAGLRRPKQRILGLRACRSRSRRSGAAVSEFAVGDHVFGISGRFGANAEFICMPESARIAHKPAGMSFEEAASICDGALNALGALSGRRTPGGAEDPRLRRVGSDRHRGSAARQALRRRGDCGVHDEEPRADALARSGQLSSTTPGRTSPRTERSTT